MGEVEQRALFENGFAHVGLDGEEWSPEDFLARQVPLDDDVCPECGGMGELIYGDGGGGVGRPGESGYTLECSCWGGTVLPPGLVCSARLP